MQTSDMTDTVDDTVDQLRSRVHSAVDKVANATTQAAQVMGEKGEQFKNVEQQLLDDCQDYIHKNPIVSLAVALGAGFLLSRLMSSR